MTNIEISKIHIKNVASSNSKSKRRSYSELAGLERKTNLSFKEQPYNIFKKVEDISGNCICSWVYSYANAPFMQLKYINQTCPEHHS